MGNNGINDFSLHNMFQSLPSRRLKKGEFLLREGDLAGKAFFVVEGCLRSYIIDGKGKEHIYQLAPEDWIISDEEALMENKPALLYIDAIENSVVKVLMAPDYKEIRELDAKTANEMLYKLERKVKSFRQRIIQLLSASAEERYTSFITTYPNLVQRVPLKMIASYLGVTPESLSRVRRELVQKK